MLQAMMLLVLEALYHCMLELLSYQNVLFSRRISSSALIGHVRQEGLSETAVSVSVNVSNIVLCTE